MSAQFTLKFDGWAPDLQNVALETDGSSGAVPCADCLNVYFQDAAFRCLPGPNPFGPTLGEQALNLFSGYDNIAADNYVYAGTANDIQLLQDGVWTPVPIEPTISYQLTGVQIAFSTGGGSTSHQKAVTGSAMKITIGTVTPTGGIYYSGTLTAGSNSGVVFGYAQGVYGSINPTQTWAGIAITAIQSTSSTTSITLAATLPKAYFTTLKFPSLNKSLPTSSATLTQNNGTTQWLWNSSVGLNTGFNYTVQIVS